MKRIAFRSYRFGAVATAIAVNEQTLRNWLFRERDLDLFTERPPGGWRSFEEQDVWVLALVVEFMRYGATTREAVNAARQAMDIRRDARTLETIPRYLYAARHADDWVVNESKSELLRISGCTSLLEIPMRRVLKDAVRRLLVSSPRGADARC